MFKEKKHILMGVSGNPILHSKSPMMFNALFEHMNVNASYLRVAAKSPSEIIELLKELQFRGMNITSPFKNSIIPFINNIDEKAKKTGSVNTILQMNDEISGYNTDISGIIEPLKNEYSKLEGKNVLIAGAGGAGISAAYAMINQKCNVTILNRTISKAQIEAKRLGCKYDNLNRVRSYLKDTDVLIITLPHEAEIIDIKSIKKDAVIFDASYKNSHYKKEAARIGVKFIDGEKWLLQQAVPAFKLLCSMEPDISIMAKSLHASLSYQNIALIGFMGSGKSVTGKLLAEKTGRDFIDTDKVIEEKTGLSIHSIFKNKGEEYFRELEVKTLQSLAKRKNLIIACGGGVIQREENRKFLKDNTLTIWLYCKIKKSLERIKDDNRPLLSGEDKLKTASKIFTLRKHLYAMSCDLLVNSDRTIEETAEIIYEEIRLSI